MKKALFILFVFYSFFQFACSSEDSDKDQNEENDTITEISDDDVLPPETLFDKLDKAKFPQDWNYDYIYDVSPYHVISASTDQYSDYDLVKDAMYEDSIFFAWKFELSGIKVMCVGTFGMYAKGGSNSWYLVTFDNDFNKIDELLFAGVWAVSVENPYGGTSAGEESREATIDYSDGTLKIATDDASYSINKEGYFMEKTGGFDPVPVSELNGLFKVNTGFPFHIDSVFISSAEDNSYKALHAGHVKALFNNGKDLEDVYGEWSVKSFIEIDSLKQTGGYDDFLKQDNLGQIVTSDAFALMKINFNEKLSAYLWAISDATYEACPYGEGTYIYISFVENNTVLFSCEIAEDSGGGDPPGWGETKISAVINKNLNIEIKKIQRNGDDDEGTVEETVNNYSYRFIDNVLKLLD